MTWTQVLLTAGPVVASVITLLISQAHARRLASQERADRAAEAQVNRVFQSRENRYVDRRDAAIGMIAAAEDELERIRQFEEDPRRGGISPGDVYPENPFLALNAAYAKLVLLADAEMGAPSERLRNAVYKCFHGDQGRWAEYDTAMTAFQQAAREMLGDRPGH